MRIGNTRLIARHLPRVISVAACVVALALGATVRANAGVQSGTEAAAQTYARWQPWLGCWELSEATEPGDTSEAPTDLDTPAPRMDRAPSGEVRVCVAPGATPAAVRLTTAIEGQPPVEETIVADGSLQSLAERGCTGWQRAEWSRSELSLFGRAELTCGSAAPRSISHLAMIVGSTWIDIESVTAAGREGVRVRRYRPIDDDRLRRPPLGASFDVDDVKEASGKVAPVVLQAALVESHARFVLNGRTLIALDEAGVPDTITDLMVALSYPERFRVSRVGAPGGGGGFGADMGFDDMYLLGYAPFAYAYWGYGNAWYDPGIIVIPPGDGGSGGGGAVEGRGRVVNGHGYTRIEPVQVEHAAARGAASGGSGSASTSGDNGSSAGSSGVSSQGYSSGGSGGSDRTAVPHP